MKSEFGRLSIGTSAMLLGTMVLSASASAQEAARTEDTVVVTGTSVPVPFEKIGQSLTVVSGEQIENGGYNYLSDVLRQVPGLAVSRTGSFGGLTQIRIRGAEANHTLVLLDGVDVSAAGNGETDLSTLMSGGVARVEVLRGPQSGLYGSNATAGVINVITQSDVSGHFFNVAAEAGSFDTWQFQSNGGFGNGDSYLTAGFYLLGTEGFDSSVGGAFEGPAALEGDKESNDIATVHLRGGKVFSPVFRIDGFTRYVNKSSQLDGFDFSGIPGQQGLAFDDGSKQDSQDFNIAGFGTATLMDGKWVSVLSADRTDSQSDSGTYGSESSRTKFALRSTIELGSDDFLSFVTGFAEHKNETYRNTYPFSVAQALEQSRELVGVGLEYRAEIANQLYISATARHDENDMFENSETYSAAGSWVIPGSATRLHASYGTGVTNPTFFEQFGFDPGSYQGNPDLNPEKAKGWDTGIEQTFLDGRVVADLTYFHSTLEDEIITVYPAPAFLGSPVNDIGESDREGVEVSFRIHPSETMDIIGSYTHLEASDPDGTSEVRRPEETASLDANWRILNDRVQLNLGVTHNGDQLDNDFRQGFTAVKTTVDAYTLARIGASYRVNDAIEVYGRLENAFDEEYVETISNFAPGQAVYVGIRFRSGTDK